MNQMSPQSQTISTCQIESQPTVLQFWLATGQIVMQTGLHVSVHKHRLGQPFPGYPKHMFTVSHQYVFRFFGQYYRTESLICLQTSQQKRRTDLLTKLAIYHFITSHKTTLQHQFINMYPEINPECQIQCFVLFKTDKCDTETAITILNIPG